MATAGQASADSPSLSWTAPALIDPPGTASAVSCVPTTASLGYKFCQVVDSLGQAGRYFPTVANGPSVFTVTHASHNPFVSVSCIASTFCLALDDGGNVYGYNGGWAVSAAEDGTRATKSISCASTSLCALIDPSGVVAYKSGVWQPRVPLASTSLSQISCAGTSCVIIGTDGSVVNYQGAGWSSPAALDPNGLTAVSCASSTYCVAIDTKGAAYTYNGAAWSGPTASGLSRASSISCVSSTFCVAGSKSGSVAMWDGVHWTVQNDVDFQTVDGAHVSQPITGVSCGTPTFCMAVDRYSDYVVYNGTTWSTPGIATSVFNTLTTSCISSTFCTAFDSHGNLLTYNGKRWTKQLDAFDGGPTFRGCPSRTTCVYSNVPGTPGAVEAGTNAQSTFIVMGGAVTDVSCASANFCVATDDIGETTVYQPQPGGFNGFSHPAQTDDLGVAIISVSCQTSTFCAAVDAQSRVLYFNGSAWSAPSAPITTAAVQKVSCAAMRLCFAIEGDATILQYNGTTWTGSTIDSVALTGLSCARNTKFCLAIDAAGNALTYNGGSWSDPAPINTPTLPVSNPTCASATFCMVTGAPGYVQFGTDS